MDARLVAAGGLLAAAGGILIMTTKQQDTAAPQIKLRYFTPGEFRGWFNRYHVDTLVKLDEFRHRLGFPVSISQAPGALGRTGRKNSSSTHYYETGHPVRGIDVQPNWPNGGTAAELQRAFDIAVEVGFTGIGVAPDWLPRAGLHLDTRTNRSEGNPAQWGYRKIDGKQYHDITALAAIQSIA